jgi:hypothetical protein
MVHCDVRYLGHTLQIFKHAGIDTRLVPDAIDASVHLSHSRGDA